jgi:hypothetical protein
MTEQEEAKVEAQEYIKCFLCGSEVRLDKSTHGCCIPCWNKNHT